MKKLGLIILGVLFFLFGVYLTIFQREAHFYTFFSIGLFIISLLIYNNVSKHPLFHKWNKNQFILFFVLMLVVSIIIDQLGIALNYWIYPQYTTVFSEVVKYVFEWVVALSYIMIFFMIGVVLFRKMNCNYYVSLILSTLIMATLVGFFTEFFNVFTFSWQVLSMPFSNYKMGEYFLVFQTLGYWLMPIVSFIIYVMVDNIKQLTSPKYFEPRK